jgi:hypothetical protein
MLINRREED